MLLRDRAHTIRPTATKATLITIIIRACSRCRPDRPVALTWVLAGPHDDRSDGSVFYRYPDGSEYYRHKNGTITFRPPEEPHEKAEGADPAATLTSAAAHRDVSRKWLDWPPQLNLSVKTDGTSVIIREPTGSTVTFAPTLPAPEADPVPVCDRSVPRSAAVTNRSMSLTLPSVGAPLSKSHAWTGVGLSRARLRILECKSG